MPQTASLPMSPPGKNSGCTTKLSVVKARRSPCAASDAQVEARLVFHRVEKGVVEGGDEHVVDQVLHRLAAAAMGEGDDGNVEASAFARQGRQGRAVQGAVHATSLGALTPPYW